MSKSSVPLRILVDTGFWIALYDTGDSRHARALANSDLVEEYPVVVPWPVLYEAVGTRLVKRQGFARFENVLKRSDTLLLDDCPYREDCLDEVFSKGKRPLSLVDSVLRHILDDTDVRIEGLLTFNPKDFSDVCARRGVEIVPL